MILDVTGTLPMNTASRGAGVRALELRLDCRAAMLFGFCRNGQREHQGGDEDALHHTR